MKQWICSTENAPWQKRDLCGGEGGETLTIGEAIGNPLYGFGCCISEICVEAVRTLLATDQDGIFRELFPKEGCGFSFCRLPIGANDFAKSWYSYNEHEGDFDMEHFSIERDKRYILPAIKDMSEIWFGTVNGPEHATETRHRQFLAVAMQVDGFREAISGVSYQWAGKFGITQAKEDYPELATVNSEMECGDGTNTWEYAMYAYEMMHHYFKFGARACVYWNMALPEDSVSTWGWKQNSLIRVRDGAYDFTPEFYLIKHFAHFVKEGAVMLATSGGFSSCATVFRNTDGSRVAVLMNPFEREKSVRIEDVTYTLPPRSFNTVLL